MDCSLCRWKLYSTCGQTIYFFYRHGNHLIELFSRCFKSFVFFYIFHRIHAIHSAERDKVNIISIILKDFHIVRNFVPFKIYCYPKLALRGNMGMRLTSFASPLNTVPYSVTEYWFVNTRKLHHQPWPLSRMVHVFVTLQSLQFCDVLACLGFSHCLGKCSAVSY